MQENKSISWFHKKK